MVQKKLLQMFDYRAWYEHRDRFVYKNFFSCCFKNTTSEMEKKTTFVLRNPYYHE